MTLKEQIKSLRAIIRKRDEHIMDLESAPKIQVTKDEMLTLVEMRRQLLEARAERDKAKAERDAIESRQGTNARMIEEIKGILNDES